MGNRRTEERRHVELFKVSYEISQLHSVCHLHVFLCNYYHLTYILKSSSFELNVKPVTLLHVMCSYFELRDDRL